jgi:putative DNA primase/helicase
LRSLPDSLRPCSRHDENSKGKTTLLIVAGSTSGGGAKNGFIRRWRATINGLEATAVSHNDILLCLDELAEVDAREVGETAYMLANGQAKLRMQKNIALGRSAEWLTLFLSTGEISLATHMATAGKQMRGGMDVRLLDLPADAGAGLGLFEELHGATSARDFADNLKEAARNYYGTPLREFLRRLAQKAKDDLRTTWQAFQKDFLQTCQTRFLQQQLMQPQIGRACDRFALVAFAGEMAAEVGITEWKEGDARIAALRMFGDWLSARGLGSTEEEAAIRQVRLFLEAHGDARFRRLGGEDTRSIENQAGLVEIESDGAVYYLKPEIFRGVVCKGYDVKQVVKTLKARQWLICNHGFQYKQHDPDNGRTLPFYAISSAILDAE